MALMRAAATVLGLLFMTHIVSGAQFVSPNGKLLKLLVRNSTGEVIVSTNTTLYMLSAGLTIQRNISYGGHFRMLAQSDIGHFMWCDSMWCNLTGPNISASFPSDVTEFLQRFSNTMFLERHTTVMSAHIIPQSNTNLIYVQKSEMRDGSQRILLNIGNITLNTSTYNLSGVHDERLYTGFTSRKIVSVLRTDEYYYYIINHVPIEDSDNNVVRLVRICVNDLGVTEVTAFRLERRFDSYYELQLQCGNSPGTVKASSATYYNDASGPHIIVSFTPTTESDQDGDIICAYNENVISSMITDKFTECSQGEGMSGLTIIEQQDNCVTDAESTECEIGEHNQYALELDTPYTSNVILSTSRRIVSMFSFKNFNFVSLFIATDDDQVRKYSVATNSSSLLLSESFNMTVGPVMSLAASPDGTLLYVLTANKVMSHSSEQCSQHSSCSQCIDQVDPVCGWCLLDNKCSTQTSCSTEFWLPSNGTSSNEQCPRGSIIDDVIISTENVPYNVMVQVDMLPVVHFDCVFTIGATSLSTPAILDNNLVTCTLTEDILPANSLFVNNDTTALALSLRARDSSQPFLNVTGAITMFDCKRYMRCGDCLSSIHSCSWCPYNARCTALPVSQSCTTNITAADSCPQLTNGTYTLHLNVTEQLVINGRNFIEGGNYYCKVSYGGRRLTVAATWNPAKMTITCNRHTFNFPNAAEVSRADADLEVMWTTPSNIDYTIDKPSAGIQVTLYQCNLLGSHCTSCFAQASTNFNCVFCQEAPVSMCVFRSNCQSVPLTTCPNPNIDTFTPAAGPINGGTVITIHGSNLGMNFEDIKSIKIGGTYCNPNRSSYIVGQRINCTTDVMNGPHSSSIIIVTDNGNHTSNDQFHYKMVKLTTMTPVRGPVSGGSIIRINGENLNIGNTQTVLVGGKQCMIQNITSESIECKTPEGDEGVKTVTVSVDSFTANTQQNFEYVSDPVFTRITPEFSFISGGTVFSVFGERLDVVQSPQILFTISPSSSSKRQATDSQEYRAPCNVINETLLSCQAPRLPHSVYGSEDQIVTIGLIMDGVTELLSLNVTINVYTNPVFFPLTKDNSSLLFDEGVYDVINITGNMFRFKQEQLKVCISNISTCRVIHVNPNHIQCLPVDANYPVDVDIPLMAKLGHQTTILGHIKFEEEESSIVVIVIAVVVSVCIFILLVLIFIVILGCVWRNSRRKDQKLDELQMTLSKLETNVAHECKEAFTQLLTDLDEYTGDLTNVTLPYFSFQSYMVNTVLSGLEDTLLSSKLRNNQLPQLRKRLEEFHHLMMDRRFLLIVIKTMEEQRDFSIREKCQMGNLLTVILHTRLDYLTQIMKLSLSDLIRKSVAKDNYRVLLRRTDSVAERILSNWLALCLHQHILDQVGQPLYTLFRAIKGQLEKGPVDVVTGDARYSLSEQRIIRQQMAEVPEIIVSVLAEESNIRANVKLLQCDTISQAKEKIFDHLYKSQPVSSRPHTFHNSDLYLILANGRVSVMRDFDYTTVEDGEWKRVNTLEHYGVHNERSPCMRLVKRSSYTSGVSDYPATLVTTPNAQLKHHGNEEGQKYWHLFKHVDVDDPRVSPLLSKKLVTEVFFPRILYTKKVLQTFVDDLFTALFSIDRVPATPYGGNTRQFIFSNGSIPPPLNYARGAESVPLAIKYLFDYLDYEAHNVGVTDHDVVHVWKNNSLSLRFWVNLIKNPEFVFDINKSLTMDACLSIVAQAFIDGCSLSDIRLNKDSPTGKLIYNRDVMNYKQKVRRYYDDIRRLPPVSEEAMISYLKGLSNYQAHQLVSDYPFSMHSALYQLLKLTARHSHKILESLRNKGLDTPARRYETILHEILTEV